MEREKFFASIKRRGRRQEITDLVNLCTLPFVRNAAAAGPGGWVTKPNIRKKPKVSYFTAAPAITIASFSN